MYDCTSLIGQQWIQQAPFSSQVYKTNCNDSLYQKPFEMSTTNINSRTRRNVTVTYRFESINSITITKSFLETKLKIKATWNSCLKIPRNKPMVKFQGILKFIKLWSISLQICIIYLFCANNAYVAAFDTILNCQ